MRRACEYVIEGFSLLVSRLVIYVLVWSEELSKVSIVKPLNFVV